MLKPFVRGSDNSLRLVPEVSREFAVCRHNVGCRVNLFAVPCGVRGNLCRLFPGTASALKIRPNLLAPRARCVEVFLCVTFDLRRSASANGDLVTELAKLVSQLGLIDGSGELLRSKKTLRLDGSGLPVCAFSDIKDDGMGMELRRHVSINRPGGVVLELRSDEFGRCLGWMIPTDPCLRVKLKLFKSQVHAFAVGVTNTRIPADKCGKRDGFRRGKGGIPPGAMLHCLHDLPVRPLVLIGGALTNQLLASRRMLALAQLGKVLGGDCSSKTELRSKAALPFAGNRALLRPVILFLRGEFLLVVALGLPG
jgi:hypothetical protein